MNTEVMRHRLAYVILLLELVFFCLFFLAAWPNRLVQRFLIVLAVIFYVSWGSLTHQKSDHLTKRIFWEYVGVGSLAGLLLFLITL